MRKTTAILLLILANFVLLTHAVVPPHHHNMIAIAFVENHDDKREDNKQDTHNHNHNHQSKEHSHDSQNSSEECLLNNVLVRSVLDKSEFAKNIFNDGLDFQILYACYYNKPLLEPLRGVLIKRNPVILTYHPIFVTHSIGLRAPPTC